MIWCWLVQLNVCLCANVTQMTGCNRNLRKALMEPIHEPGEHLQFLLHKILNWHCMFYPQWLKRNLSNSIWTWAWHKQYTHKCGVLHLRIKLSVLNELHLEAAINLNMLRDGEKGQHGPGLRPSEVAGVQRDGWLKARESKMGTM